MFHRVKSETTSEEQSESKTKLENLVEAQQELDAELEDAAPAEEEATSLEVEETVETPSPKIEEKEIETMNTTEDTLETAEEKTRPAMPTGAYGRSTQSAVRPGGYPGAYPGVAYGAAPVADQAEATDRTLTIGAGITMSGEIESCDNLIVEGTVEAALKGARNLDIAESGTFYGTVEIEDAVIAGRFEGELNVTGRLVLRSGGFITGSIAYGELEIEAGAVIDGRLTPIAAMQQAGATQPASQPKAKPAPKAKVSKKEEQPEAANSEGALFAAQA